VKLVVSENAGEVSALLERPADAQVLYVLAHGAGAGMRHSFMDAIAEALGKRRVATFRYAFPYMEAGKRRPDHFKTLIATVRAAVAAAARAAPDLPIVAGGKSMGGRMTSRAAAEEPLPGVRGLVFVGFPLHPPKKDGTQRAEHLADVAVPMLFVQGTRDRLARMDLIEQVVSSLGARARMHVIESGDHGFHVLKRSGRTDDEALDEIADAVAEFALSLAVAD
jgi:predicted alpha/beta-hydrolase family hydrolase